MKGKSIEQLSGKIKTVTYKSSESGYMILKTTTDVTLCGVYSFSDSDLKDMEFIAKGSWVKHKKYGYQFNFSHFEIKEGELFYFLSRVIKGIGESLAKTLLEKYEEDELIEILENSPKRLLEVKGIKEKKLQKITANWNKFKELKTLSKLLIPAGATQSIVNKIYKHFESDIIDKLKENPYLMMEVKGIGFKSADKIARALGISPNATERVRACINFVMIEYTNRQGNSCISQDELYEILFNELKIEDEESTVFEFSSDEFMEIVIDMIEKEELVKLKNSKITSSFLNYAENFIINKLFEKLKYKDLNIVSDIKTYIETKEKEMNFDFSDEQKEAIETINRGFRVFVLCGYAGTGKSTISKAILDLLSIKYSKKEIICSALSGIASDRIRKTSGYTSATIQSLLMKADKLEDGKLPQKVVLLDEASMVNSELLFKLLRAIDEEAIFIMVGDPAQLPPIGAGNPFSDIITNKLAPTIELTKIYRQSDDKVITLFANEIRNGEVPSNYMSYYEDFEFKNFAIENYYSLKNRLSQSELKEVRDENSTKMLEYIKSLAKSYKNTLASFYNSKETYEYITHFQIITPRKDGIIGVENLNREIQSILNPKSDEKSIIELGKHTFHIGDKVVHIQNQDMDCIMPKNFKLSGENQLFKTRVFNGMIGVLFQVDKDEELLWVYYPTDEIVVEYGFDEARDLLRLAYTLTIHKTQGSEYKNVVIPISLSDFMMLNSKLIYTAITRAKDKVIMVGENYAFKMACRRKDVTIRDTVINNILVED